MHLDQFSALAIDELSLSAFNMSSQHQDKSWESQESNPGLLGEKCQCYLYAVRPPRCPYFCSSRKNRERRENVISELVVTEREFCRDLKLTWQAFGLDTPAMLEQRGVDVPTLFGNVGDVIDISERFLDTLQVGIYYFLVLLNKTYPH